MVKLIIKAGLDTILPETKDQIIANEISQLTHPNPPDIAKNRKYLLNAYILNFELSLALPNAKRQHGFNFIRRTEGAFIEYCCAVKDLRAYAGNPNESVTPYFLALLHFEQCVAQLSQAISFTRKVTGEDAFKTGDGSVPQRVWDLHNASKHMSDTFEQGQYADENSFNLLSAQQNPERHEQVPDANETSTTAIWITNDGLKSSKITITFEELADFIMEYYEDAGKLAVMKPKQGTDNADKNLSKDA